MGIEDFIQNLMFGALALFATIKLVIVLVKVKTYDKVIGIVTSSYKKEFIDADAVSKGAYNKYHFEHNGRVYDIEDNFYEGNTKLKEGSEVYFYISKKDDNKIVKPGEINFIKYWILVILVCIFGMIIW